MIANSTGFHWRWCNNTLFLFVGLFLSHSTHSPATELVSFWYIQLCNNLYQNTEHGHCLTKFFLTAPLLSPGLHPRGLSNETRETGTHTRRGPNLRCTGASEETWRRHAGRSQMGTRIVWGVMETFQNLIMVMPVQLCKYATKKSANCTHEIGELYDM